MRVEVDGAAQRPVAEQAPFIRTTPVGVNFFATFQAPIVAGRSFNDGDLERGRNVAIVDQTLVRQVLNGQPALGRFVRDPGGEGQPPGPWLEIVGVVTDLTDDTNKTLDDSVIYRPAPAEAVRPLHPAVHASSNPSAMMSASGLSRARSTRTFD